MAITGKKRHDELATIMLRYFNATAARRKSTKLWSSCREIFLKTWRTPSSRGCGRRRNAFRNSCRPDNRAHNNPGDSLRTTRHLSTALGSATKLFMLVRQQRSRGAHSLGPALSPWHNTEKAGCPPMRPALIYYY